MIEVNPALCAEDWKGHSARNLPHLSRGLQGTDPRHATIPSQIGIGLHLGSSLWSGSQDSNRRFLNERPVSADSNIMSAQGKWIEQFGFSGAANAPKAATSEALFSVLAQGQLLESDYFPWAQTTFELPFVSSEFFAVPVDPVFWDRVKDVHAWAPHLYPIAEWDGVLLIACVEPPSARLPIRAPHRFVLAGARNLQMYWKNLNPGTLATIPTIAAAPAPAVEATPAPVDVPDGFALSSEVSVVNFSMPDGFTALANTHEKAATETPDGFNFGSVDLAQLPESPDGFATDEPAVPAAPTASTAPIAPQPPAAIELAAPAVIALSSEPAPVVEAAKPVDTMEMTNTGFTITNSPDPDWVQVTDPKPVKDAQTLEQLATHTLSTVVRHFTGGLIFVAEKNGFISWRFTAPFRTPRKPFGALNLEQPSLFRIVDRTQLSYHGHTSPAPENDRFFKAFLGGKAPAHVTVIPVIVNKKCIAMIMGIADSAVPFRHVLPVMENLAADFGATYTRLQPSENAAA